MNTRSTRRRSRWLSLITAAVLAPALCAQGVAPAPAAPARKEDSVKLEKYVVTGSLIKRLEGEGALPVVTLTPDELELRGIASAEQMMMELNINSNGLDNLASNADVVAGQQRGNNGDDVRVGREVVEIGRASCRERV